MGHIAKRIAVIRSLKRLLYSLLVCFAVTQSCAQSFDSSLVIPQSSLRNSSFTAFFLIDSFSKAGDSVQASVYLMRLDPYYLMFQNVSPSNLDTFFSEYKLKIHAKDEFRKKFEVVYNAPHPETYGKFREMFKEDQAARNKLGNARDSFTNALFEQRMNYSDSVHFDYLYKYVKKYGWPKLADGGLYAEFLALHDGIHMNEFLPFMKKAVLMGQANPNMYNNVLNRAVRPKFAELSRKYKKVSFDISYMLKHYPPTKAQMDMVRQAVNEFKPIKYMYFEFESSDKNDFDKFCHDVHGLYRENTESYSIAWYLLVDIEYYQESLLQTGNHNIPYQFAFSESSIRRKKLTLYLLY